jgi:hypothetical protein
MIVLQSWPLNLFMSQATIDVNISHKKHKFLKNLYFFEDKINWLSIKIFF